METNTRYDYVSLELAQVLRKLGFDWPTTSYYQNGVLYEFSVDRSRVICINMNSQPDYMNQFAAPTLGVANKYLRAKYNCHVETDFVNRPKKDEDGKFIGFKPGWMFRIQRLDLGPDKAWFSMNAYDTPEEAESAGLYSVFVNLDEINKHEKTI